MTRYNRISQILTTALAPEHLKVINDSRRHAGHAGVRALPEEAEGETHFKIIIQAAKLKGLSRVAQHRLIYELLQDELQTGLHSLEMRIKDEIVK